MNRQYLSVNSPPAKKDAFDRLIRTWAMWFRFRRAVNWSIRGVIFGLSLWIGFAVAASYYGFLVQSEFIRLLLISALACLALAVLTAFLAPIPVNKLAHSFDRYFGLQDRISTAVELQAFPDLLPGQGLISQQQRTDALGTGLSVKPSPRFFLDVTRLQLLLVAFLVAANIALVYIAQDWFTRTAEQRLVREEIQDQIDVIEELQAQIEANQDLSPEQREQIKQALEQAQGELAEADSREEAIAIMTSAESELRSLDSQTVNEQAEALKQAGTQLQQSSEPGQSNPLASLAESLAQGDFISAATQLDAIDPSDLSAEENQALADQLSQLADSLAESNPALAEQLQKAADALQQGDIQAAQQAMQAAAQQMSQAGQQIAAAQAAQQAASQLSQGSQQLAQSGQTAQSGQPGQGTSQGSQAGGQSSGGSSTQSGGRSGAGAGQGESPGSSVIGPEAGDTPIGTENGPGDGGEKPYEQIFAPSRLGAGAGDTVTLPSSGQPGDQVIGTGPTDPGNANGSSVPYESVILDYSQAYWQAMESGQVPPSMRELVRKYFSSLENTSP